MVVEKLEVAICDIKFKIIKGPRARRTPEDKLAITVYRFYNTITPDVNNTWLFIVHLSTFVLRAYASDLISVYVKNQEKIQS